MLPRVRGAALSQSFPTPKTHELLRVVTRLALGAPELAFVAALAPIAPEPFVPDVSTPVKLSTAMDEATLCERFAVTATPVNAEGAKARQISAVPSCTLLRCTSVHVSPPPDTPFTTVFVDEEPSAATNASSNSFE